MTSTPTRLFNFHYERFEKTYTEVNGKVFLVRCNSFENSETAKREMHRTSYLTVTVSNTTELLFDSTTYYCY